MAERPRATRPTRPLFTLVLLLLGVVLAWVLLRRRAGDEHDPDLEQELAELWSSNGRVPPPGAPDATEPATAPRPADTEPVQAPAPAREPATAPDARQSPDAGQGPDAVERTLSGGSVPDDLQQIDGVGPVLERTLHGLGITTFHQIATMTPEDVRRVGAQFRTFRDRIEREQWVEQARRLYEAKYGKPVEPAGSG